MLLPLLMLTSWKSISTALSVISEVGFITRMEIVSSPSSSCSRSVADTARTSAMFNISSAELINTLAFLLCVVFCAYVVSILVLYLRAVPEQPGDADSFEWHVIIPCLNEAAVVGQTARRLLRDFPRVTVWCVDDESDDGTAEVLDALAQHDRLRVLRRVAPMARQGKGAALNAGWRAIRAELGIPIKLVGLGEGPEDLIDFDAGEFVEALVSG